MPIITPRDVSITVNHDEQTITVEESVKGIVSFPPCDCGAIEQCETVVTFSVQSPIPGTEEASPVATCRPR